MGRLTTKQSERLKTRYEGLISKGMSINQMARELGVSPQAVHQYLKTHKLMTVEMERRAENNIDNDSDLKDKDQTPRSEANG